MGAARGDAAMREAPARRAWAFARDVADSLSAIRRARRVPHRASAVLREPRGHGLHVLPYPAPSHWGYGFNEYSVWTAAERITVGMILDRWRWWEMRVCDGPTAVVRDGADTGTVHHYCSSDRVVIYVQTPGPSAEISVRLPARMHGAFIDAESGATLSTVRYDGQPGALSRIAIPTGHGSVVLALEAAP